MEEPPPPPPPKDQSDRRGKTRNVPLGKSGPVIFGTPTFGSQTPPPPPSSYTFLVRIPAGEWGTPRPRMEALTPALDNKSHALEGSRWGSVLSEPKPAMNRQWWALSRRPHP